MLPMLPALDDLCRDLEKFAARERARLAGDDPLTREYRFGLEAGFRLAADFLGREIASERRRLAAYGGEERLDDVA